MLKTVVCLLFFLTFVNMVFVSLALMLCVREHGTSSRITNSMNGTSEKARAIAAQIASAAASASAREATAAFLGV